MPQRLKINFDGLVKSRKTDFLPQHIGIIQDDDTICCGQNKMLGLFTRPSILIHRLRRLHRFFCQHLLNNQDIKA